MLTTKCVKAGLIVLALLVMGGCATIDATTAPAVGAPRFSPSDPAAVQILRQDPPRQFDQLGQIVLDASTNPAPPVMDIEARLRSEAAKLGADAVVIVWDRIQPIGVQYTGGPWWGGDVEAIRAHRLVGVAIRFK